MGHARIIPQQVGIARHDLRNPLGEILGFADILADEARELGHPALVRELQALSQATEEIFGQLNLTLVPDFLLARPEANDELGRALQHFSQDIASAATSLHARCAQLPGQPFLEDLVRIRDSVTPTKHGTSPPPLCPWPPAAAATPGRRRKGVPPPLDILMLLRLIPRRAGHSRAPGAGPRCAPWTKRKPGSPMTTVPRQPNPLALRGTSGERAGERGAS